jgi:hypothetical protein
VRQVDLDEPSALADLVVSTDRSSIDMVKLVAFILDLAVLFTMNLCVQGCEKEDGIC